MDSIVDEPVRGVIGDTSWLRLPGLEAARMFVAADLARPPIHHLTGIVPTEAGLGSMTFAMPVTPWLQDATGIIYGGVYAFLVDAPISLALYTGLPPGQIVTTADLSINYLRPPMLESKRLVGRARSVYLGREVGVSEASVEDASGRTMAHATTRCVVVEVPFDPDSPLGDPPEPVTDPRDPYLRPLPDGQVVGPSLWDDDKLPVQRAFIRGELPPGPLNLLTGLRPIDVQEGRFTVTLPASPWLSAGAPVMYGGALALACDTAMTGAVWSTLDSEAAAATLDLQIRFLRPVMLDGSTLTVTGEVRHSGRSIRVAQAEAFDAGGKRVALATGSAMVIPGGVDQFKRGRRLDEIVGSD